VFVLGIAIVIGFVVLGLMIADHHAHQGSADHDERFPDNSVAQAMRYLPPPPPTPGSGR